MMDMHVLSHLLLDGRHTHTDDGQNGDPAKLRNAPHVSAHNGIARAA
jgi:hypothetical protein